MEIVGVYEWRLFDIGLNLYLHPDGEFEEYKDNPFGMLEEAATLNRKGKWTLKGDTLILFSEGSPKDKYQILRTSDSLILQKELSDNRLKRYYKNSNKPAQATSTLPSVG